MVPNKFTTMLNRRSNRITRVLIYALLEWILISLLLLNSLFSLLILKFARYFGLKPPCILCSRLDHHFLNLSTRKNRASLSSSSSSYKDLICEEHAAEISRIGYCSNHRKLVESQKSLCLDCSTCSYSSSSMPEQDAALFRWMREIGIVSDGSDSDDDVKKCSCCENIISTRKKLSFPFVDNVVIKPLPLDQETGDLVMNQRELLGSDSDPKFGYQALDHDDDDDDNDDDNDDDEEKGEGDLVLEGEKEPLLNSTDNVKNKEIVVTDQNLCPDMLPQHLEFYIDHDDYRLIPVGLINNSVKAAQKEETCDDFELVFEGDELITSCEVVRSKKLPSIQEDEQDQDEATQIEKFPEKEDLVVELSSNNKDSKTWILQEEEKEKDSQISQTHQEENKIEERNLPILQDQEEENESKKDSQVTHTHKDEISLQEEVVEEVEKNEKENVAVSQERQQEETDMTSTPSESLEEATASHLRSYEIGAERNEDETDKILLIQEEESPTTCKHESSTVTETVVSDVSTSSPHLTSLDNHDDKQTEGEAEAGNSRGIEADITEESLKVNVVLTHNEVEEEKVPDTPTSVESLHHLHKKLMLLGRRESATEESLDGSIVSEIENGDGAAMVEKLKSELQAERKALRALYKELEEERNAAAIAANQTMAMINRLQEEKASMQMEALQYQRMMEEQSEYDQEALQMMNELMVKREKEKQELEKELEVYRKKVMDYEEREKMRMLCRRRDESMRSRNSSASCSYGEESDGLSIDLNHEAKDHEEDKDSTNSPHSHDENGHQDTPTDAVLGLQDSLASFEEERYAILEQLKALEEKLFTLAEEEEEHIHNMKPFEQFCEEINGKDLDNGSYNVSSDVNADENGFSHLNGKHQQENRINGSMQKRLLPLFDATELESSDGELHGKEDGFDSLALNKCPVTKFDLEKKRLAIEEEVDHVYERLQALEADREFLKHCIGSLKKGDKGLDLLQEILQHLRDLKNVELQVMKNMDLCASV